MPFDLGSKDSCMIGGNLSTNAGGLKVIRNKSQHANIIGLKAVLPNGKILDNMTTLKKDNTGYDLKQLFVGAEGTLGVITECAILCPPLATKKNIAVVALNKFEDVFKLLQMTKASLGDILHSYEVMDQACMEVVVDYEVNAVFPFSKHHPCYVFIAIGSSETPSKENSATSEPDRDLERLYDLFG